MCCGSVDGQHRLTAKGASIAEAPLAVSHAGQQPQRPARLDGTPPEVMGWRGMPMHLHLPNHVAAYAENNSEPGEPFQTTRQDLARHFEVPEEDIIRALSMLKAAGAYTVYADGEGLVILTRL